jgi:hypothetical protein
MTALPMLEAATQTQNDTLGMAENSIRSISDIALKSQQAQNRLVEGLDDLEKISAGINEITSGISNIAFRQTFCAECGGGSCAAGEAGRICRWWQVKSGGWRTRLKSRQTLRPPISTRR